MLPQRLLKLGFSFGTPAPAPGQFSFGSPAQALNSSFGGAPASESSPSVAAKAHDNSLGTESNKSKPLRQQDTKSMRIGDLKRELEDYGISSLTLLEKSELVAAVDKARADRPKPKTTSTATTEAFYGVAASS